MRLFPNYELINIHKYDNSTKNIIDKTIIVGSQKENMKKINLTLK